MDKHGIGTDATIAQHISTIQVIDYLFVLFADIILINYVAAGKEICGER